MGCRRDHCDHARVLTSAADAALRTIDQNPLARASSMALNAGSVWDGLAILAGWLVSDARRWEAPLAGFASLVIAVVGYYAYGTRWGDRSGFGLDALNGPLRQWLFASVLVGPILGVVGAWCRRDDFFGLFARMVWPGGAIIEMLVLRRLGPATFQVDAVLAWTQLTLGVVAVVAAICSFLRWRRRHHNGGMIDDPTAQSQASKLAPRSARD